MIQIAIVEDEQLAAKELAKMLERIRPGQIKVNAVLENVDQAVKDFSVNTPDLIFMDIHLGDGNSFGIFDRVEVKAPIIFTTAYDQYALQAFKQFSIDYLLKPIDEDDLENALQKFERFSTNQQQDHYLELHNSLDMLLGQMKYQERFLVNTADRILSLKVEEVAYFMADGKSLYLFGVDGHRYLFEGTLSALEKQLNPKLFFRINRKFTISYQAIKDMHYYSKSRIKLTLNPNCPEEIDAIVSQERSVEFKRWLNK